MKAAAAVGTAAFIASPSHPLALFGGHIGVEHTASPLGNVDVVAHELHGRCVATLDAMHEVFRLGADAIDIDVRRSRDGELYVWHDANLRAHRSQRFDAVEHLLASELDKLGLLRVRDAISVVPTHGYLVFEVKADSKEAVASLLDLLRHAGGPSRMWLRSPDLLRQVCDEMPLLSVGLLKDTHSAADTRDYVREAIDCGARHVSIHPDGLTASAVRLAHRHDIVVYCYARSPSSYATVLRTGIDGLITDAVSAAVQAVKTSGVGAEMTVETRNGDALPPSVVE